MRKNGNSAFFYFRHARKTMMFLFKKWINHIEFYIIYFHDKKINFEQFFFPPMQAREDILLLFFFLQRGQNDPHRSSSTKQYTECCLT